MGLPAGFKEDGPTQMAGRLPAGFKEDATESAEDLATVRERIEPGIMGETSPTGQRLLENAGHAAGGYFTPGAIKAVASIPGAIKRGLGNSNIPFIRSLGKNTKALGEEYNAQNAAIGVARRVPVEGGMKVKMAPVHGNPPPEIIPSQYPRNTGAFLNYANSKLKGFGNKINPQELMDWQVKLQTDLNSGAIPKIDKTTGRITTVYQQAVDLLTRTKNTFNEIAGQRIRNTKLPEGVMPTREGLNKTFGYAAKQEALVRGLKKAGKWGAGAAIGIGGGNAILNRIEAALRRDPLQ